MAVRADRALLVSLLVASACAPAPAPPAFPGGQIVDLSHAYDASTVFWPTADPFVLDTVADGVTDQGFYYAANRFRTSEHGGTHLDAPVHFARGKHAVDAVPLSQLIGPAVVIDVVSKCIADRDYQVRTEDFLAWERTEGVRIPSDAILLIRTGYSQYWPDAARYLGTAERGAAAVPKLHFPGIHPDAARWLAAERPVKAVGIDTASIDYGQSTRFETHQILYAIDIPGLENLTNLDRLPARGAHLVALPMKIRGGTGAPLRAIGIVADTLRR